MEPAMAIETTPPPPVAQTICAVIVTYHPDSDLFDRIERVAKQVAQTVIVDNGSPGSCIEQIRKVADKLAMHLILNASNEGIACALNEGARWAVSRGYRWVLTLDQDTVVAPDMIDSLAEVFRCYPFPERLAVIGSNYRHKANGRVLCDDMIGSNGSPGREMKTVLTSGSLVSADAFQAIGGFRDEFFIDCVDHEYCLRARAHGFNIMMTSKPVMEHGLGYLTEHRLLWRKVGTSNHSPARRYFMTRNTLILAREYIGTEPQWILRYLWASVKSILLVCLFEKERIPKVKNIIRGCIDGILGRTSILGS
jgi:rhamnosyltransferase